MLASAGRMIEAVAKGMETEIQKLDERKYSFRFRNNPYRIQGWQGLLESCLRHTGVEPKTEVKSHGARDNEYIFEW